MERFNRDALESRSVFWLFSVKGDHNPVYIKLVNTSRKWSELFEMNRFLLPFIVYYLLQIIERFRFTQCT